MSELGNVSYEIASAIAFVFFNMTSRKESHELLYNNALVEDIRTVLKDLFFLPGLSIFFVLNQLGCIYTYVIGSCSHRCTKGRTQGVGVFTSHARRRRCTGRPPEHLE